MQTKDMLYKGKSIITGEWIEGRLIADDVIIPVNQEFEVDICGILGYDFEAYTIYPETLGLWSGAVTDDGDKIYENDTVSWRENDGRTHAGKVIFQDKLMCFVIRERTKDKRISKLKMLCNITNADFSMKVTKR